ncbi:hypothetical protein LB506_011797, partial [Fusarium annulatum]
WRCSPTCTEHHIHVVLIEVTYPASLSSGYIKNSQNAYFAKPVSRQFMPPAIKGCNIEYFDVNARHFCTLCTSGLRLNDDVHIDRVTFHDNLSVRLNRDQDANANARDSVPNRRWLFPTSGHFESRAYNQFSLKATRQLQFADRPGAETI